MLMNKPVPICFKNKYGRLVKHGDLIWGLLLEWYRSDMIMKWEPVFQETDSVDAVVRVDNSRAIIREMRELAARIRAKANDKDNNGTDTELAFEASASSIECVCDKWEPPAR